MNVTFGANEQPANTAVTDIESTVTPTATPATPATPADATPAAIPSPGVPATTAGTLLGDRIPDFKDIVLPRVNIVQNIGQLCDSFDSGILLLNQTTILFTPPIINTKTGVVERAASPPCIMTVLGFRPTRYVEKVPGGGKGLIVNTEAEVASAGGTLDYAEFKLKEKSGIKRFEPLADALVAIQRPEACADDDTVFVYDVDGKKYTLALWAMKGTAYTAAAKRVFFTMRRMGCLMKGYPVRNFAISTREDSYPGGNKAWVPVCIPAQVNTPTFMEFVKSVLGG